MLKSALAGVALTVALLAAAAFALVESGYIPANADAAPGRLETWIASTSLDATLNREAPKEPNPVALTDENLLAGVNLFAQNCAVCHGDSRGLPAASPIARGLYQKPPQMATDGVEDDPEGTSFWKIKHGLRLTGMPSFGSTLSDKEIWTLALFLKHMDKLPPAPAQAWEKVRNWPPVPR
ncbi:c-type cytochrome [Caenimonas terrae]|uniref:C-type cytochrome n=1 Tax=Caenimonas terrae TaxID=696074 RepID=A0ABW0N9I1_9BURK